MHSSCREAPSPTSCIIYRNALLPPLASPPSLPPSLPPSGIATYIENPEEAYQSLVPLLDFALSHIPEQKWSQTSLYVLCTAGMRFLEERDQALILGHLSRSISLGYPFRVSQDGIQVISGQMEGVCERERGRGRREGEGCVYVACSHRCLQLADHQLPHEQI